MKNDGRKLPPDVFQSAMNAAIPKYSGEKAMRGAGGNCLDALIKPKDEYQKPV